MRSVVSKLHGVPEVIAWGGEQQRAGGARLPQCRLVGTKTTELRCDAIFRAVSQSHAQRAERAWVVHAVRTNGRKAGGGVWTHAVFGSCRVLRGERAVRCEREGMGYLKLVLLLFLSHRQREITSSQECIFSIHFKPSSSQPHHNRARAMKFAMEDAVDKYDDEYSEDDDGFFRDEDEDEMEEEEEEEEEDAALEREEISVGVSYDEGKEILAEALEALTPGELRDAFDGHAGFLHDESRNAAYRQAIEVAAKGSKCVAHYFYFGPIHPFATPQTNKAASFWFKSSLFFPHTSAWGCALAVHLNRPTLDD
jgi:hypothetical protein